MRKRREAIPARIRRAPACGEQPVDHLVLFVAACTGLAPSGKQPFQMHPSALVAAVVAAKRVIGFNPILSGQVLDGRALAQRQFCFKTHYLFLPMGAVLDESNEHALESGVLLRDGRRGKHDTVGLVEPLEHGFDPSHTGLGIHLLQLSVSACRSRLAGVDLARPRPKRRQDQRKQPTRSHSAELLFDNGQSQPRTSWTALPQSECKPDWPVMRSVGRWRPSRRRWG